MGASGTVKTLPPSSVPVDKRRTPSARTVYTAVQFVPGINK
jgi:hypothetical protein